MKTIILILNLFITSQALAQGTISFYGDMAYSVSQELAESENFSCDLEPGSAICQIKTKIILGNNGKAMFSGQVAADFAQVENFEGITCQIFLDNETYCQVESKSTITIDAGKFNDQILKN